jgi:glycosyltransferase involved in cell wall biosynthesis
MRAAMRFCFVNSQVGPGTGDQGAAILALARLFAHDHEVVVVTPAGFEASASEEIHYQPIAEPGDLRPAGFTGFAHIRAAGVLAAIELAYPGSGPDLIEVPDAGGTGALLRHAQRGGNPVLADTLIVTRLYGTVERAALINRFWPEDRESRLVRDLEREQLRGSDRLLSAGGQILSEYQRIYDSDALPSAARIRVPVGALPGPAGAREYASNALRLLYVGRLDRGARVTGLVHALRMVDGDITLTIAGTDIDAAPLGQSMRMTLECLAGEDPRISFVNPGDDVDRAKLFDSHDLLVVPSGTEVWPTAVLEGMSRGLPILAVRGGDLSEIVAEERSGWFLEEGGAEALARALARLVHEPERLARIHPSGPQRRAAELTDEDQIRAGYARLLDEGGAMPSPHRRTCSQIGRGPALVSAVLPHFRTAQYIEEALTSFLGQNYAPLEAVIVNDGSFGREDVILDELAADPRVRVISQPNRGHAAARNTGILHAKGEFVVPLDADTAIEPGFINRAVTALKLQPELAYVTCWTRYIDQRGRPLPPSEGLGYSPLGNFSGLVDVPSMEYGSGFAPNVAGDIFGVYPRRLFTELGYWFPEEQNLHPDWEVFRRLYRDGRFGLVIPERLLRYRVRSDSASRLPTELHERALAEASARLLLVDRGMIERPEALTGDATELEARCRQLEQANIELARQLNAMSAHREAVGHFDECVQPASEMSAARQVSLLVTERDRLAAELTLSNSELSRVRRELDLLRVGWRGLARRAVARARGRERGRHA